MNYFSVHAGEAFHWSSAKRMNLRKDSGPGSPADTCSRAIQNLEEKYRAASNGSKTMSKVCLVSSVQ
jgi:hypothetical protein